MAAGPLGLDLSSRLQEPPRTATPLPHHGADRASDARSAGLACTRCKHLRVGWSCARGTRRWMPRIPQRTRCGVRFSRRLASRALRAARNPSCAAPNRCVLASDASPTRPPGVGVNRLRDVATPLRHRGLILRAPIKVSSGVRPADPAPDGPRLKGDHPAALPVPSERADQMEAIAAGGEWSALRLVHSDQRFVVYRGNRHDARGNAPLRIAWMS